MIAVRKAAGLHSQSQVLEESSSSHAYSATIQGHHKKVIVRLGNKRDMTMPEGYFKCVDGDYYTMYIEVGEGVDNVQSDNTQCTKGEKFVENGQLYIRVGEHVYDATGRVVE